MADQFPRLNFPFRGVFLHDGTLTQPPETTPEGQNVRAYDASQDRHRGGSRAGISRWIDEQVSGENPIQFLGSVTSTDPEAMGWVFEGEDFGYTGVYGGIGFVGGLGGLGGEIQVNGDGGYPSTLSYNKPKYHLEMEAFPTVATVGDVAVITGRFFDENGDPPDWEVDERRTVELRTTPEGRDGHGLQATTGFSGVVTFDVENETGETVTYSGKDITKRKNSTVSAEVEWEEAVTWTLTDQATGSLGPVNVAIGATVDIAIARTPDVAADYRRFESLNGGAEQEKVGGTYPLTPIQQQNTEAATVVFRIQGTVDGVSSNSITIIWS